MVRQYINECEDGVKVRTTYQSLPMLGLHRLCDFAHCEEDSGRAARHRIGSPSTTLGFGASSTAWLGCHGASSAGPLLEAGGEVGPRCEFGTKSSGSVFDRVGVASWQTDVELQQRLQRCQTAPSA